MDTTLKVYSLDIKGEQPTFRNLHLWEIERDNLALLSIQDKPSHDFEFVSPDALLDYIGLLQQDIFVGTIIVYTIDEIKELF